ncbi:MAG TPA: PAS domain S-box protein [Xanthobacteraceae bacterium]|nr:PAS domain S-box protein [Xanthobacteraceae bacterium]
MSASSTNEQLPGSPSRRFWRRPWPLRTALGLFALSLVLPAVLFFGLQYRTALGEKRAEIEHENLQLARSVGADVNRELDIKRAQLAALATSPALRDGDYAAFYAQARAALKASQGWIALLRRDGTQLINTLAPAGAPLDPVRATASLDRVLDGDRSEESDVFNSRISKRFVITVFYPVGYGDLVLSGALPVEYLSDLLRTETASDRIAALLGIEAAGSRVAVLLDREGRVIARNDSAEEQVGKLATPELRQLIASGHEGSATLTTPADAGSFAVFTHLANGWTAVIQIPPEVFAQAMRTWERQVLLNLAFFALLAVIGAAAAGEWIARSISQLAAAARRIGSGEITAPVATSLREVNDVGEALSRASHDRRRAEEALRESDTRFRAIVDQDTAGISIVDLAGRFRLANRRHCEITGYPFDELADKSLIDITHPADRPRNLALLAAMMASGTGYTIEKRFVRKDGRVVWVQVSSVAVRDSLGVPQYAIGLVLDIDERKQAEMANAHLAAVVTSSADAIESVSLDGTILTWNQAAEELYGYTAEEAIGHPLDLIVPEDRREEIDRTVAAVRGGDNMWFETKRRRRDGTLVEVAVDAAPIRTAAGSVVGVSQVTHDISERRRAEAALQEREEQFRTLANSIPQLVWMANADGWIVWYNERWYDYTGTTPEQMEGDGWHRVHDPQVLPDVVARWNESVRTGQPFDMTFPLRGADGVFRSFLTRVVPLHDSQGEVARWFGTSTDVTAQVEHETHLNFVMRELSHRSKNLLAVVQAMARQTMQHSVSFEDFEGRFMGRLHGLARSHDVLVRQDWTGGSIRDLVAAQLAPFVREDGASVDLVGDNLVLKPDAVQNLGFALFELGTNAVKYGALAAPAGKVTIRWGLTESGGRKFVRFVWQESGGPPVAQPLRKGFGAMVIERFIAVTFGGHVESLFLPEGFCWTLEIPAEHLLGEAPPKRPAAVQRIAAQ